MNINIVRVDDVPASGVPAFRVMVCVVHYAVRAKVVSISPLDGSCCQDGRLWRGEEGHGPFGQVAAVLTCHSSCASIRTQAESRCRAAGLGEDPDDVGPPLDLSIQPLQRLVAQTLRQCASGKSANAVISARAWRDMSATTGSFGWSHGHDGLDLCPEQRPDLVGSQRTATFA
jgi:hypothetical protein